MLSTVLCPFLALANGCALIKCIRLSWQKKYHRNYTPYLLGQRGSASLTHYFGIQQINKELKNKQAVYVISPQWFTSKGASASAFSRIFLAADKRLIS